MKPFKKINIHNSFKSSICSIAILAGIFPLLFVACTSHSGTEQSLNNNDSANEVSIYDTIIRGGYGEVTLEIRRNDSLLESKSYTLVADTVFYSDGCVKEIRTGQSPEFDGKTREYFHDGHIKNVYQQGLAFGCGMRVGEELFYDSAGSVRTKIIYENMLLNEDVGCHQTWTIIDSIFYSPDGKLLEKCRYKTSYEAGIECPCGEWTQFNKEGEILIRTNKGNCKDGILNCE